MTVELSAADTPIWTWHFIPHARAPEICQVAYETQLESPRYRSHSATPGSTSAAEYRVRASSQNGRAARASPVLCFIIAIARSVFAKSRGVLLDSCRYKARAVSYSMVASSSRLSSASRSPRCRMAWASRSVPLDPGVRRH
jgi:hypothetical protein